MQYIQEPPQVFVHGFFFTNTNKPFKKSKQLKFSLTHICISNNTIIFDQY